MIADPDHIPETALAWARAGRGAALATVVETWGSAPRPKGAQLAIAGDGAMAGSVSGGCVEGAVVAEALDALGDGRPRVLEYGVSDQDAFAVGLACGGTIRVMVEPIGAGQGPDLGLAGAAGRRPGRARGRRSTRCGPTSWERRLVAGPGDPLWEPARAALAADRSGFSGDWFLGVHNPPLRHGGDRRGAHRAGAGADGAARRLRRDRHRPARGLRQRRAASPTPGSAHDWPDEALAAFGLDARTAVVTLTHDPKLDDPAIARRARARRSSISAASARRGPMPAASRGCREAGFAEAEIARIHAPIGADIGAAVAGRDRGRDARPAHRAAAPPGDPARSAA